MRISYRTSLRLVALLVIGVVCAGIYVSSRSGSREISLTSAATSIATSVMSVTGTTLVLTDFERRGMRGSKIAWELKAKQGELDPASNTLHLTDARLQFQDEKDNTTVIVAQKIKAAVKGTNIDSAELFGKVELKRSDLQMNTEEAVYDKSAGLVRSPGSVTIRNKSIITTGTHLDADLNRRRFVLHSKVTTVIQPGGLNKLEKPQPAAKKPAPVKAKSLSKPISTAKPPSPSGSSTRKVSPSPKKGTPVPRKKEPR